MILNEAIPPIEFVVPPPAHVQTVDKPAYSFAGFAKKDQMRRVEAVVACIVLEAAGEGRTGMEAVNEVIHNRAKKQHKSLYDIVTAHKQFSCFNAGVDAAIKKAKHDPHFKSRWDLAIQILQAPLTNHTNGATYYHTTKIQPYWVKDLVDKGYETVTVGHHKFYYL